MKPFYSQRPEFEKVPDWVDEQGISHKTTRGSSDRQLWRVTQEGELVWEYGGCRMPPGFRTDYMSRFTFLNRFRAFRDAAAFHDYALSTVRTYADCTDVFRKALIAGGVTWIWAPLRWACVGYIARNPKRTRWPQPDIKP